MRSPTNQSCSGGRGLPARRVLPPAVALLVVVSSAVAGAAAGAGADESEALTVEQCGAEELALAQRLQQAYPRSDEALVFLGKVHWDQGRAADAAQCWEQALRINPRRADAYQALGQWAREQGRIDAAIAYWRQGLKLHPRSLEMRVEAADALISRGEYAQAIEALQQGLPTGPLEGVPGVAPGATWHYLMGESYRKQREYERARSYFEEAVALDPAHTSSYYGLFNVCLRLGLKDKAAEHAAAFRRLKAKEQAQARQFTLEFQQLRAKDRRAAEQRVGLSERQRAIDRLVRRYMEAQQAFEAQRGGARSEELCRRALGLLALMSRMEPDNALHHLNAGMLNDQLRRFPEAQREYRQAIELAPERDSGYRHLARSYLSARTKLAEARQLAEKAVSLQGSAENYFTLGFACRVNDDRQGAVAALEAAVKLAPREKSYRQILERLKGGQ